MSCRSFSLFSISSHLDCSSSLVWKGEHLSQTSTCQMQCLPWRQSTACEAGHLLPGLLLFKPPLAQELLELLHEATFCSFCSLFLTFLPVTRNVAARRWSKILMGNVFTHINYNIYLSHHVLIKIFSFQVVTTGNPVLDYETMPKSFDLQIFVEDTTGRTDLNILTVQVTDINERPIFRGNMAVQSKIMVVFENNNTWKDDIRLKNIQCW